MAHVAAAGPMDIRVDGKVLFSNVANAEAVKTAQQYTIEAIGPRWVELM